MTMIMSEGNEKTDTKMEDARSADVCKRCGNTCNPYDKPSLRCSGGCSKNLHVACLTRGTVPASFVGDTFFELNCAQCNPFAEETVVRDKMPWLNVIVLTLYNLREKSSGISKRGYFHWKSDISTFVDRNWEYLFKKTVKRKKNWIGTISGTLSHYSGIFFKSGTTELGESGWWRLLDNDPPEVLIAKNGKMISERKKQGQSKSTINKLYDSPTPSESSVSLGEDSNLGNEQIKAQVPSMYSHAYVQPTEVLSDFLMEEDELNDIDLLDIEESIGLHEPHESSFADLIGDFQYPTTGNNSHFSSFLDNFPAEWACHLDTPSASNDVKNKIIKENEQFDEDTSDSSFSMEEQPPASLFHVTEKRDWPWQKVAINDEKIPRMTHQEEAYLLQRVDKSQLNSASPAVRRLYRKLAVRKLKREYGLRILDIDHFGKSNVSSTTFTKTNRVLDRFVSEHVGNVFEQRLQGYNEPTCVHSPYTDRLLKPFIRRDLSCRPLWLRVMDELLAKVNSPKDEKWKPPARAPIDYSYVRPQHIPAINSLCSQFFWPGIDLTECLQYPDFSCVVLYKKLVVGFAILVPDVGYNEAYISFCLTRPEWRKSGIGTFMLYHLIQTCMGKDVTLHVSATNPALILYQKFGFKVEEFIQDFYDKYMPPSSRECKHALFLRLSR